MDRYQRVVKTRAEEPISENEIRITAQGLIRNYISYASSLLQEKQLSQIILKAMGQAISKTVAIAEIIKNRIPGLYQEISISSMSITDIWEPIEEGLVPLEMTRQVSLITITLSTMELNKNSPGYQAPTHIEQRKLEYQNQQQKYQPKQADASTTDANEDPYGWRRGRGRGRGKGMRRGRLSRVGFRNSQEYDENSNWDRGFGRSRGLGYGGAGYERGRGGRRGYGRVRGRAGGRGRLVGNQA